MPTPKADSQILIAGAGPTGLALAAELCVAASWR
jgi:2-polyprenyl-6-methoxyphenol hydroxylase-like FAD-dependent oxidoreductase